MLMGFLLLCNPKSAGIAVFPQVQRVGAIALASVVQGGGKYFAPEGAVL